MAWPEIARPEVMAKGTGIRSSCDFIAARFGDETLAKIVGGLPADLREIWPELLSSVWYPARFHGALWSALAEEVIGPSQEARSRVFRELGRHVAEDNLSTVYRVLISLAWPDTLISMLPRLWRMYFDHVQVEVKRERGAKHGQVTVSGLGEVPYLSPVACGWLELAYAKVGARDFEVVELEWQEGHIASDRMVFLLSWG